MSDRPGPDGAAGAGTWHLTAEDVRAYRDGEVAAPLLWSVEAHLMRCAGCREAFTALADPARLGRGWARLDAAVDAPVPGVPERALLRSGVPDHVARLLVTTPAARGAWLLAAAVTFGTALVAAT